MPLSSLVLVAVLLAAIPLVRRLVPSGYVDLTPLAFLRIPYSAVAFRVRRRLALRRGEPRVVSESKEGLFEHLSGSARVAATERARALEARYDLDVLRQASTRLVYGDNLYFLDLLDRLSSARLEQAVCGGPVRALDVGSQDFRYATALERWLARSGRTSGQARSVELTGIELDGHVVYADLHSRADHGERHARLTGNPAVRYRVQDFRDAGDRDVDVIFVLFPFVLRYALVQWGLPLGAFDPTGLFAHAARALRPGGLLVVLNHTHEERDRQRELLDALGALEDIVTVDAASDLASYSADVPERTLTLATKRRRT